MHRSLRALTFAAALALAGPALAETVTLTFVQTNDIDRMEEEDGRGGFARLAAVVKAERAKGGPTFFVHSGDTLSPSLLSGIDKGVHIIDILNHMGVDVMVPGNHEFDFGPEVFRARIAEAKFPVVSSNILEADGTAPKNTVDTRIVEVNGVKVGFYGLTTEDTPVVSSPGDITFAPSIEVGIARAAALREAGRRFRRRRRPHADRRRLRPRPRRRRRPDPLRPRRAPPHLLQRQGRADRVGGARQLRRRHRDHARPRRRRTARSRSTGGRPSASSTPPRSSPTPRSRRWSRATPTSSTPSSRSRSAPPTTPLDSRRATVRGQEAAIGNLITDAMREAVGADVAITNGGGIRADREYPAGTKLTRGDIFAELPFGNKTVKFELTGADIRAALENGFSQVETARRPLPAGLRPDRRRSIPAARPASAIVSVRSAARRSTTAKTYTLATNDFMANGGDGYTVFKTAKALINPIDATLMASQVIDYIAAKGTVAPAPEGRIVIE